MPDFNYNSKFNKDANFSSIKFGADAPLLETELNELQSILLEKVRDAVRIGFKDGVISAGELVYSGSNITMRDFLIVVDGDVFYISELTKQVSKGNSIYVAIQEEEVTYQSTLKKYGNKQEANIVNHLYDDRVRQETTKRKVLTYDLTTTAPSKGLKIGEIVNSKLKLTYVESSIEPKSSIGVEKPLNGGIWYEEII